MVPVEDRVEAQGVGSLSLPTPEGPQRKHHDVALADGLIEGKGAIGEGLTTGEFSGEQNLVGLGGELQARRGVGRGSPRRLRTVVSPGGSALGVADLRRKSLGLRDPARQNRRVRERLVWRWV